MLALRFGGLKTRFVLDLRFQGPILASAAARKQPPGTVGQLPGRAGTGQANYSNKHRSGSSPLGSSGRDVIEPADIRRFGRQNVLITCPTGEGQQSPNCLTTSRRVCPDVQFNLSWVAVNRHLP